MDLPHGVQTISILFSNTSFTIIFNTSNQSIAVIATRKRQQKSIDFMNKQCHKTIIAW